MKTKKTKKQMHGVNHEMRDKYRVVKVKMIIKK